MPPYIALAFIAMALATIPYGAPMPAWYMWTMAAVGAALVIALAADPLRRWRSLTYWPIPVILGVWACSIAACQFPREVLGRSWEFALFSILFVAVQAMCWNLRARKGFVLAVLVTLIAIGLDVWWSQTSSKSLIRELPSDQLIWDPIYVSSNGQVGVWRERANFGSQSNRNDHAVVAVLMPLVAAVTPTIWAWGLWLFGALVGAYDTLIVRSRQLMLGVAAGTGWLLGLHAPTRLRWWTAGGVVSALAVVLLAHPASRERLLRSGDSMLTGRSAVIAYGMALYSRFPVFGVGPSLYGHYYVLGVRERWTFRGEPLSGEAMPWVHSLPVEVACEMGTVGLAGHAVVLWCFVRRLRAAFAKQGPARQLAIATSSAAVAMTCMGLIDLTFIKDWVRICWWLLLGLGFAAPTLPGAQGKPKTATLPHSNGL